MDHHCPWINNCCGHMNHVHFTAFLFFSVFGAIQSTVLLAIALYRGYYANWYFYNGDRSKLVYLTLTSFLMCVFSIGLAVGVILAVGGLFIIQLKTILRNKTSIEEWIVTKAEVRDRDKPFIYPYDFGKWNNFKQLFFMPLGNGIDWPVVDGCDKYSLTIEQLVQKSEKRTRMRYFQAICDYNGSWFPLLSQGFRTTCKLPITDEPRLPLKTNDTLCVTRWKTHWLYGEKANNSKQAKGWFPRRCVVETNGKKKIIDLAALKVISQFILNCPRIVNILGQ
ncbi:putative palmitoyltransferase ZDHHC6-like protein [Leptotrombidium deliense]|uniref:Palmitoyltransferase n=1 Tax=Leptotrombidium deliense TaxID=299467 RepID=A0A443SMC8_9ACAR|nr:putative palmitoyltransferase ZDHHC6-like protein [Leptotrombidium deliense]